MSHPRVRLEKNRSVPGSARSPEAGVEGTPSLKDHRWARSCPAGSQPSLGVPAGPIGRSGPAPTGPCVLCLLRGLLPGTDQPAVAEGPGERACLRLQHRGRRLPVWVSPGLGRGGGGGAGADSGGTGCHAVSARGLSLRVSRPLVRVACGALACRGMGRRLLHQAPLPCADGAGGGGHCDGTCHVPCAAPKLQGEGRRAQGPPVTAPRWKQAFRGARGACAGPGAAPIKTVCPGLRGTHTEKPHPTWVLWAWGWHRETLPPRWGVEAQGGR